MGRSGSGARHGEKSQEESIMSGNSRVEGGIAGVLIYSSSRPGVHFLTVSHRGVYSTSKELEVGCIIRATSHLEVDTGIVGQMN